MDTPIEFNKSEYLKQFRWHTLGLRQIPDKRGWETLLADGCYLSSWQTRVQTNLTCELWAGKKTFNDGTDGFLTEPNFHICHDGKSFQLKVWGELLGNWPKEKYKGIDFSAEAIQSDLAAAEAAFCNAWAPFGIEVSVGKNIGYNPRNIWWNRITIPFKDLGELISGEFAGKLRVCLIAVTNAFAPLLKYRIPSAGTVSEEVPKQDEANSEKQGSVEGQTQPESASTGSPEAGVRFADPKYLMEFRDKTLGMQKIANCHAVNLNLRYCLTSEQTQLENELCTKLWAGPISDTGVMGDLLAELKWQIVDEGESPTLKMFGAIWGNSPREKYKGIDFDSSRIQKTLEAIEKELCWNWYNPVGHNSSSLWWNCCWYRGLSDEDFRGNLTAQLIDLANLLKRLLPFRISAKQQSSSNNASAAELQKKKEGEKYLETALDYDFGRNGKKKEPAKAVEYYKKCLAVSDSGLAFFNLAISFLTGDGIAVDKKEGYTLVWKSHHTGYPEASFYLARCYEQGKDCAPDFAKAAHLYREAADKGHAEAAFKLGLLLKAGKGVEKNPAEAFRFFSMAVNSEASKIKPEWLYECALCHIKGFGTAKNPSAGIWAMQEAAEAGNASAQYEMAIAYDCGIVVTKDEDKKWNWMRRAADNDNALAAYAYGEYLLPKDKENAVHYMRKAAYRGHAMAQVFVAQIEEEKTKAEVEALTRAAEKSSRSAQYELGMMYLKGEKVQQNARLGFDWLSAAAEQGNKRALAELGWCYLKGIGVPRQNPVRAFEYFKEAAGPIKGSTNQRALRGLYHCYNNGIGTVRNRKLADDIKLILDINSIYRI